MDELEQQAFCAAVAWLIQTNNNNALAVASTLYNDDEPIWPWKPYKRLGPIRKLINDWKSEDKGGLSDYLFEFFTRFTKIRAARRSIWWSLNQCCKWSGWLQI